jgi:hypothetical protein
MGVSWHPIFTAPPDRVDLVMLEDFLHLRRGTSDIYRGAEYLPPDLVDAGRRHQAVKDALQLIAMDWGFLDPRIG